MIKKEYTITHKWDFDFTFRILSRCSSYILNSFFKSFRLVNLDFCYRIAIINFLFYLFISFCYSSFACRCECKTFSDSPCSDFLFFISVMWVTNARLFRLVGSNTCSIRWAADLFFFSYFRWCLWSRLTILWRSPFWICSSLSLWVFISWSLIRP